MTNRKIALTFLTALTSLPIIASANAGVSGGLSLLSVGNARAAALGQAYTASFDDVAGMAYNPASLSTLRTGQASLLYQKGLIEDSYGQLMVGSPQGQKNAFGLSAGYYNGGKIDLIDANGNTSQVTAQQDFTFGLNGARKLGAGSVGFTVKYLQSTLIQQATARAYAFDLGVQTPLSSRLRIGAAALNYGTKLTYLQEGDNLPRMLRAGASYLMFRGQANTSLLVDAPYMVNEKYFVPSIGVETLIGPLSIRAGYRTGGGDIREFTMGAGFMMGGASLDYAFGLMNQLDAQHKISLATHFGGPSHQNLNVVRAPVPERKVTEVAKTPKPAKAEKVATAPVAVGETRQTLGGMQVLRAPVHQQQRRVYIVKEGDTLAQIAENEMGDKRKWQALYTANRHLIDNPKKIEKGMKIVIP